MSSSPQGSFWHSGVKSQKLSQRRFGMPSPEIATIIASPFGRVALAWRPGASTPISRIYLPGEPSEQNAEHEPSPPLPPAVLQLAQDLGQYFDGKDISFDVDGFDWQGMSTFHREVLRMCFQIPRGKVSPYGELARRIGKPCAARAVGTAMARNPFPIVIPCHRVVRSDGAPGHYGGGAALKRELLRREGIRFERNGRVPHEFFW
jgi:methylated-DNA-[protein]-cysteine S-methyltransferase